MQHFYSLILGICLLSKCCFGAGIVQADAYHKNSNLQWEWALKAIEEYPWKGNEHVLDIGCGDGKITAEIAKKVPFGSITGLDVSAKMISFALAAFPMQNYPNLSFLQENALSMNLKSKFDLVVSFCALHWVLDQKQALLAIKESLVEGGKALIVVPAAYPTNLSTLSEKLVQTEKWRTHFPSLQPQRAYFHPHEYEALLIDVGLTPLSTELTMTETLYPNLEALIDWLRPLLDFTAHLSPALQEQFLKDLAYEMVQVDQPDADGAIRRHILKMEVLAQN